MNSVQKVWVALIVVALIAIGGYFYPTVQRLAGAIEGPTTFGILGTTQIKIGTNCANGFKYSTCSGTAVNGLNTGTCFLAPSATTIAATTTVSVDCQATAGFAAAGTSALTGVTSGDAVQFMLSTTTAGATGPGGLVATSASASTTAGYITVRILNLTGTTFTWPTIGSASGTAYYLVTR